MKKTTLFASLILVLFTSSVFAQATKVKKTYQWADAAVSANMKFGLLTTKHHEGLCLWNSKFTDYDIASTPYKKDIVQQYVDAFRKKATLPPTEY